MDSIVWTLTNLITSLIMPPGLCFALIAVGLWQGRRHAWGRWLAGVSLAVFVGLSLNAVAYGLAGLYEDLWRPLDPAVARSLPRDRTVIVVLAGGKLPGALEYPEGETLSSHSFRRAIFAARLAEQTGLRLAVSGGNPTGGALGEAVLIKNFIERSLKGTVAFVEDQSFDTRQNALYMVRTLAQENIRTIVLVTDVLHMPRAVHAFQAAGSAAGLTIIPAPMHFFAGAELDIMDFLPSVWALEVSRYALREFVGEIWYRLRRSIAFN